MALNSYFLQGADSEQRLVQDLINEQLRTFGVEVTYIPRKFVNRQTVIEEVQTSKFDDNFQLEVYVNNYEGYGGQADIMTKFGMSIVRDELSVTISKERFEDFIGAFLVALPDEEVIVDSRPKEGDLIFFPLGGRLFEIKFVEHEDPFYQLGNTYVYQLKCELFEYENEVIDTSIEEIDEIVEDEGFITTLKVTGAGTTAAATAVLSQPSGYIRELRLLQDGSGYTATPTVAISTTGNAAGQDASAVAITTVRQGVHSIERIVLTDAGSGYTSPPTVTIVGGNGTGATADATIETSLRGVKSITLTNQGAGYPTPPIVTIAGPGGAGTTATAEAVVNADNVLTSLRITDPGQGYTSVPNVVIAAPSTSGVGTFYFNEVVHGESSGTDARVKDWDEDTGTLKISQVGIGTTVSGFIQGETVIGTSSTITGEFAQYVVDEWDNRDIYDEFDSNDEFETEADSLLDFTESNPFGVY